jgi:hypothetical protein
MKVWERVDDDGFDYQAFFDSIVALFCDEDGQNSADPWVKETLSWWNMYAFFFVPYLNIHNIHFREVFGVDRSSQQCQSEVVVTRHKDTDTAIIAAQRKARRLRAMNGSGM